MQWQNSLRLAWMSIGVGMGTTAILLLAGRLTPILLQSQLLRIGMFFTVALFLAGQLWVWLQLPSVQKAAKKADTALNLDERLITALELSAGTLETSPTLKNALFNDTLSRLANAPISQAMPLGKSRWLTTVGGVMLALSISLIVLATMPNPQDDFLNAQAQLDEMLAADIAELEALQTEILAETDPLSAQKVEAISDEIAALVDRLEKARAEKSAGEAMAALSEAQESLRGLESQKLTQADALESMADTLAQSDTESAQAMANALENGDPAQAAEALSQMGDTAGTPAGSSLAQTLSDAAQSVAANNPALAQSLQSAADALASGDAQSAQDALNQAAQQLAQAGGDAQSLAQVQQSLANIEAAQSALAAQQGGTGSGQGAQANRGDGQGQGNGSGRGDPSGAGDDSLTSTQGTQGIIPTDNGANQNRTGEYDSVFAPQHLGGEGGEIVQPAPQNPDGGFDVGERLGDPNRDAGAATVPYADVYRQYADDANVALESDSIPLSMKDYVRQYFGALEP